MWNRANATTDERQQAAPVAQQDVEEERDEDRDVAPCAGPAERGREVREPLVGVLERVLAALRDERDRPGEQERQDENHRHHDPAGEERRGDREVRRHETVVVDGGARVEVEGDVRDRQLEVGLDTVGGIGERPRGIRLVLFVDAVRRDDHERDDQDGHRGEDDDRQRATERGGSLGDLTGRDDGVAAELRPEGLLHPAFGVTAPIALGCCHVCSWRTRSLGGPVRPVNVR